MEKYIRAKIFKFVNPNLEYFRKMNQNHSLTKAIDFLIEVLSNDNNLKNQIRNQLDQYVFEGINFQYLHNNLRYPFYSEQYNNYSIIEYDINDCVFIENKNERLKNGYLILTDYNKYRNYVMVCFELLKK
jgi:hypothetical protein